MNIWQLRKLGKITFLQKLVKLFFRLYFRDNTIVKIKRGPLKGLYWACSDLHQFWMPLGTYEQETSAWLVQSIKEKMTFIDIGANAGYFTLLGSRYVGNKGKTVAFEPMPQNIEIIGKHVAANKISNVVLENMAISDINGEVKFVIESNNANSHLLDNNINHAHTKPLQIINIKSMRLDEYVTKNSLSPDVIKIDVEGAEVNVLKGARETLIKHRPVCIVSTHSKELFDECYSFIVNCGYSIDKLKGFEHELLCYPISAS